MWTTKIVLNNEYYFKGGDLLSPYNLVEKREWIWGERDIYMEWMDSDPLYNNAKLTLSAQDSEGKILHYSTCFNKEEFVRYRSVEGLAVKIEDWIIAFLNKITEFGKIKTAAGLEKTLFTKIANLLDKNMATNTILDNRLYSNTSSVTQTTTIPNINSTGTTFTIAPSTINSTMVGSTDTKLAWYHRNVGTGTTISTGTRDWRQEDALTYIKEMERVIREQKIHQFFPDELRDYEKILKEKIKYSFEEEDREHAPHFRPLSSMGPQLVKRPAKVKPAPVEPSPSPQLELF